MNSNVTNDLLVSLLQKNFAMKQRVRLDFDQQTIQDLKTIHSQLCYFLGSIDATCENLQAFMDEKKQTAIDKICSLEDQIDNEQQSVSELLDLVDLKNADIQELEQRIASQERTIKQLQKEGAAK